MTGAISNTHSTAALQSICQVKKFQNLSIGGVMYRFVHFNSFSTWAAMILNHSVHQSRVGTKFLYIADDIAWFHSLVLRIKATWWWLQCSGNFSF